MVSINIAKTLIIIIFYFMAIYCQKCDLTVLQQDQIQSGTVDFIAENNGQLYPHFRTYIVPIIEFNSPFNRYEVAVSTSLIQGLNTKNGFQYAIIGAKQARGNQLTLTVKQGFQNQWTLVKVSYLVSADNDIILGRRKFIFSVPVISVPQRTQVFLWIQRSRIQQKVQYKTFVFISGIRINKNQNNFSLALTGSQLSKDQSRVLVDMQVSGLSQIEQLLFYYIIYPQNSEKYSFGSQRGTYEIWGTRTFTNMEILNSRLSLCKKITNDSCIQNQIFISGKCECDSGFIKVKDVCKKQCGANQYLNQDQICECLQGYYKINKICSKCQNNSQFDGETCVCNQGFFQNEQNQCETCFQNCASCTGQSANQCLTCHSQSYTLQDGACNCPIAQYSQKKQCKSCTDNCLICTDFFTCIQCSKKYHIVQQFIGVNVKYCEQDCGDNILQEHQQCDDGNIFNNDGCDQTCNKELNITQIEHELRFNGIGRLFNRTIFQFRFSKMPSCFDSQQCSSCNELFQIQIEENYDWVSWNITYNSLFRTFIAEFRYRQILANSYTVKVSFKKNMQPKILQCLTVADLSQTLAYRINIIQFRFQQKIQQQEFQNNQ